MNSSENLLFAKQVIDYFLEHSSDSTTIALIAVIISVVGIVLSVAAAWWSIRDGRERSLLERWDQALSRCVENPKFLDRLYTENFWVKLNAEEQLRYNAFCYQLWDMVQAIVKAKFEKDIQFNALIHWASYFHGSWLERNPAFFHSEHFWKIFDRMRNQPHSVMTYKPLPQGEDDINWDELKDNYSNRILGPFDDQMLGKVDNKYRNPLLQYLASKSSDDLAKASIAEFGCGPGLFLRAINKLKLPITKVVCVDKSQGMLDQAVAEAERVGIEIEPIRDDMRSMQLNRKFDYIVCANAILPSSRVEIIEMLKTIRGHLSHNGKLIAILPSYDTTAYLEKLWVAYYNKEVGEWHGERIRNAIQISKLVDQEACAYADDGCRVQCYHTPETIDLEFKAAGLKVISKDRVYYPWELTKKFDYGDFAEFVKQLPNDQQEVWDWFVIAER